MSSAEAAGGAQGAGLLEDRDQARRASARLVCLAPTLCELLEQLGQRLALEEDRDALERALLELAETDAPEE